MVVVRVRHPLVGSLVSIQTRDGLTGAEMARRLNVVPSSYTRLVSGEMQPSLRIVQAVSQAFPELRAQCAKLLQISEVNEAELQGSEAVAS